MVYRALMVMRMDPSNAAQVAQVFADHDRTDLPRRIGATGRTLFRFHDLYMHLVEAEHDIMPNIYAARDQPGFKETDTRLARLLTPYSETWREMGDSRAEVFYTCRWD